MSTPLLIGPEQVAALHRIRDLAAQRPVDMRGLGERLKLPKLKAKHMRQMSAQTVDLPLAFRVTFSIETGHPGGPARHMSMSVAREDRVPHPEGLWMVAEALGFTGSLEACQAVWVEDLQGHGKAINVVQLLNVASETAA
jgi:hypothetical protein